MSVRSRIPESFQVKKKRNDLIMRNIFRFCSFLAATMIVLIFVFVLQKGIQVFLPTYGEGQQNFFKFISGMSWRQDQGKYGIFFIIVNTVISSVGAAILAFPVSILTALFIVKIAPKKVKDVFTTIIELLAAIPSVVYGVFAAGVITQYVDSFANMFGFSTYGGNSLLAVILLLAIMIFPTITSIAIVSISAVPVSLEHASLALGASKTQTNFKVVLSSAKSGIFAGLILGLGRAFGEATAVSMVAGNSFTGITTNLFKTTRTLTSTMLSGLKETTGADYDIRFSVGIILMILILFINFCIHRVKKRIGGIGND